MEAKIDKDGNLLLKRNKVFTKQFCPYDRTSRDIACGDWCPKFIDIAKNKGTERYVSICTATYFDLVEDKRDYKEAKDE